MRRFVLDTSVIVKWFSQYDEGDLSSAFNLREEIIKGKRLTFIPDLALYELANALRYNPRLSHDDVISAIESIIDIGIEIKGVSSEILKRAIDIAYGYDITVYDAAFLALSEIVRANLVTADYRFIKKIKGFRHVIALRDL